MPFVTHVEELKDMLLVDIRTTLEVSWTGLTLRSQVVKSLGKWFSDHFITPL